MDADGPIHLSNPELPIEEVHKPFGSVSCATARARTRTRRTVLTWHFSGGGSEMTVRR